MDFLELTKRRYSARAYSSVTVEQEKLNYILECARQAPSAVNRQPWRFVVVRSDEAKQLVRQCYEREWFAKAPLYIIVYNKISEAWVRDFDEKNHGDIDAAIATEHICVAAAEQGLGSCWVCNFDVERLKNNFQLGSDEYPLAIVPIGYVSKSSDKSTARKPFGEVVSIR